MAILLWQVTKIMGHLQACLDILSSQTRGLHSVTYIHSALLTRGSFAMLRMTSRATEIATSGTALLAMTTPCVVILNEVKNLLEADKRPRT